MNRYKSCVDDILTNYQYNDDTESESDDIQIGGMMNVINKVGGNNINVPTGGFPPIYICEKEDVEEDKDITKREFKVHKTTISIKDIMKKRRDVKPFIS